MDRKLLIGIIAGVFIVGGSVGFSFYKDHETTVPTQVSSQGGSSKYIIDSSSQTAQENNLKQSSPENPVNKKGLVESGNINGANQYKALPPENLPNINDTKFPNKEASNPKESLEFSAINKTVFSTIYPNRVEPVVADSSQANILVLTNQKTLELAKKYKGVIDNYISSNNSVVAKKELAKLNQEATSVISTIGTLKTSYGTTKYATMCTTIIQNLQSIQELTSDIYNTFTGTMSSVSKYYQNLNNTIYVIQSNLSGISSNINYNRLSEWTHSSDS